MSAVSRMKTHCIRGHELIGENLVRSQLENAGIRNCRTCWNENARARRRRNSTLRACQKCRGSLTRRREGWKVCLKCTELRKQGAEYRRRNNASTRYNSVPHLLTEREL